MSADPTLPTGEYAIVECRGPDKGGHALDGKTYLDRPAAAHD